MGVPGPLWAAWVAWGCLRLSWGSLGALLGARLVHSWAVVVKVVLVVVVVVASVVVVVVVVVAVGRTRGCWSGCWFGVRWVLVGFGWLGPLVD